MSLLKYRDPCPRDPGREAESTRRRAAPSSVVQWPGVLLSLVLSLLWLPGSVLAAPFQGLPPDSLRTDTLPSGVEAVALPALEIRVLPMPMALARSPLSVSVAREVDLARARAGWSLEESLQALPGLQVQNRYNLAVGERIILRGFGARAQFGVRGLKILVDGIPATLPDGQSTLDHLDLPSLGRLELLRGPASSLYGNGAGGVLRFESRWPAPESLRQEAVLTTGSHGLRRAASLTSGTLGDTGYLLSLEELRYDGFRAHPLEPGRTYGGGERRSLNGRLTRPLAGGTLGATLNLLDLEAENPGSLGRSGLEEGTRPAYPFNVLQGTGKELVQAQGGLTWEGGIGDLTGEVAAHAVHRDLRNPIPPAIVELDRRAGGLRAALRGALGTGALRLTWTAGAELQLQDDRRRNYENRAGSAGPRVLDQEEEVLGRAVFLQGMVEGGSRLQVLAGLRYQTTRFRVTDRLVDGGNPDDSGERAMEALSPSLAFRATLGEGLQARASVSTLFQTPTTSELANRPSGAGGFNRDLDPQEGTGFEVGLHADPDPRVSLDGVLFLTRLRKELVPFQVPDAPGRSFYRNAGRSRYRGGELSLRLLLPGKLRLRSAYTYTDARFTVFPSGPSPAPGSSGDSGGGTVEGNRVPGVAPHRWESVLGWDGTLRGGRPGAFAELRALYQSAVPADDENTARAGAHFLLDLRGGLRDKTLGGLTVSPFLGVTNLLDRRYVSAVTVNAFGSRFFEPGPGRAVHLGLRIGLERP
jgi:iron complex outermembrane receptor protein